MRCSFCETELPSGALFCGECGRAVSPTTPAAHRARVAASVVRSPRSEGLSHWGMPRKEHACAQCGAVMSQDDIFCGECGYVSRAASEDFGRARDTVVIDLEDRPRLSDSPRLIEPPVARTSAAPEPAPVPPVPVTPVPVAPVPVAPVPVVRPESSRRAPSPASLPFDDAEDLEATRIVRSGKSGDRFVLQFSTGESFTVFGTGLIGRNPNPEPGEYFDQLVRVLDPSRSVSKVHLEFGQESGSFWVQDRFSGNGTIIREPDASVVRCEPQKRFRVARGTRVEIGEQFFIVS